VVFIVFVLFHYTIALGFYGNVEARFSLVKGKSSRSSDRNITINNFNGDKENNTIGKGKCGHIV